MDYWSALEVLGLEDDDELTRDRVRRTYMRKLRDHPPERDPEGFRALREAYERLRFEVPDEERERVEAPSRIEVIDARPEVDREPAAVEQIVREMLVSRPAASEPAEPVSGSVYSFKRGHLADDDEDDEDDESDGETRSDEDNEEFADATRADADEDEEDNDESADETRADSDAEDADDNDESAAETRADSDSDDDDEYEDDDEYDNDEALADDDDKYDDESDDNDDDDDDEQDNDDGYGYRDNFSDERFDEIGRPAMALSSLIEKLLLLLQHDEVNEAVALEEQWRKDGDTDDHRNATEFTAVRWALTRELLHVAPLLPAPVVKALAQGVAEHDLSAARPALEAYRYTNPYVAEQANMLLAERAPDLYKHIKGTLFVPPVAQPQQFTIPEPPIEQKTNYSAVWVVLGIILIFVRIAMRDGGSSSSSSYDSSDYRIDPEVMERLRNMPKFEYVPPPPRLLPPAPIMYSDEDRGARLEQVQYMLSQLEMYAKPSDDQRRRMNLLDVYIHSDDCPKIRKTMKKLEDVHAAEAPVDAEQAADSRVANDLYHRAQVDRYFEGMRARIDYACPDPMTPKATPKKTKKKKPEQ